MIAKRVESTTPTILTPDMQDRTYVFNVKNQPKYVAEIPGVRFNGVVICLATDKLEEVSKVHFMTREFKRLWEELAAKAIL